MFHSLHSRSTSLPAEKAPDKVFLSWPAVYMDGCRTLDADHWQLDITGLVSRTQQIGMKDIQGLTRIQQNRRLVFADGWTYRANWEGVVAQELLHRIGILPEARYLIQTNAVGHRECVPLADMIAQRALFCTRVNGKPLPSLYGGPFRLLCFDRYAHKGLPQLVRLELSAESIPGWYADKGYEPDGVIAPGDYYAADLQRMQAISHPGEVTQF